MVKRLLKDLATIYIWHEEKYNTKVGTVIQIIWVKKSLTPEKKMKGPIALKGFTSRQQSLILHNSL
jgi:hypothetical protein